MSSSSAGSLPTLVRMFGRYRVVKTLGTGTMGEVFLAHDDLLARDVAVKTLRLLGLEGSAAESFRARFLNEARAVAALAHPHVVRIFDLGFEGDLPYLVMERLGGSSLHDRHEGGRHLSVEEVRVLGVQLAQALEAAHARGIVHRDVKPANVIEAEPRMWMLADFGVAHVPDSKLTVTGQFIGSPAYAAPEALLAGEFSPATDIYGVGATLYEALAGQPPHGDTPDNVSVVAVVRRSDPQPIALRRPDVPAELARAIQATLSRDPAARPSAAELAAALLGCVPIARASPALARALAEAKARLSAALRWLAEHARAARASPALARALAEAKARLSAALRWLAEHARAARASPALARALAEVKERLSAALRWLAEHARAARASSALARTLAEAKARPSAALRGLAEHARAARVSPALARARPSAALSALWKPTRRRWVVIGGVAAAALILGLAFLVTGSQDDGRGRTAASLSGTSQAGPSRVPGRRRATASRSPEQQRRWQKVQEKLDEGKLDDAARELEKLLKRDPDDEVARQLLEQITGFGFRRRRG